MAISQNGSTATYAQDDYSDWTQAHTNNGDLLVIGLLQGYSNDDPAYTVTYGAQAMTLLDEQAGEGGGDGRVLLYYKATPLTGSNDIVVSFSGGDTQALAMIVSSWDGIDTGDPFGTPASAHGHDDTPTVGVSSASGELVIDVEGHRDTAKTLTVDGSQSQLAQEVTGSGINYMLGGMSTEAGDTSVTMSWAISAAPATWGWMIVGAPMQPAAGSAPAGLVKIYGS